MAATMISGVASAASTTRPVTRAEVRANLLTVNDLTNQFDHWKQRWRQLAGRKHQPAQCGVALPSPRFDVGRFWFDRSSIVAEAVEGSAYTSHHKALHAVRLAYNAEKSCKFYVDRGTTFYPTSRFRHHFRHTTAYCTTERSVVTSGSAHETLGYANCRFVVKTVRYEVYVAQVHGAIEKAQTLTTRAVHKVYANTG
jgi:hypothetical protein